MQEIRIGSDAEIKGIQGQLQRKIQRGSLTDEYWPSSQAINRINVLRAVECTPKATQKHQANYCTRIFLENIIRGIIPVHAHRRCKSTKLGTAVVSGLHGFTLIAVARIMEYSVDIQLNTVIPIFWGIFVCCLANERRKRKNQCRKAINHSTICKLNRAGVNAVFSAVFAVLDAFYVLLLLLFLSDKAAILEASWD